MDDKKTEDKRGPVKARVLTRIHHDGEWLEPDTILTAPADVIKGLEGQGSVDSHEASVAYAQPIHDARVKAAAAAEAKGK